MNQLELAALDGANPLGFLAALGTLALLSETEPRSKLGWHPRARWTPFLTSPNPLGETEVLERLSIRLRGKPVDAAKETLREEAQKRVDIAKKAHKSAVDSVKKLGLRGKQRDDEWVAQVVPRAIALRSVLAARQAALKEAVPSPELALGQRPDCTIEEFREVARPLCGESMLKQRCTVDMLAGFGVECANDLEEKIMSTPFCFITGSGHQWFLDTARQLMGVATDDKLREALLLPWSYTDEKLTMRWDPLDDRRYALMDRDPTASDNKSTTVWMANLLAYFALALFPCTTVSRGTATACWTTGKESPAFRWPVWERPLSVDTIRSLLTHQAFAVPDYEADRGELRSEIRARGVAAIYSTQRIQVGNPPLHKINFSPAVAL